MRQRHATIVNKLGLHARAATQLVNTASRYQSGIWISLGDRKVNGKSIMGVLTLAATTGSEVLIEVEGEDEEAALEAVAQLIANRFGEDE